MAYTIGIRREDKSIWERRAALTPENVAELVSKHGMRVLVQPSDRRVFKNVEYEEAGAELTDDLREASAIFGVKEVPPSELIPERTFVFFSHTIKAQPYNMPLLDRLLSDRIRLIDYECITRSGQRGDSRLVAFGRFAGIAGAVDMLRGLGERFLNLGYSTPLLNVAATYMYPNEAAWRAAVTACGVRISQIGLPEHMCPFVCAVTGRGNVSRGAQEILKLLPHTVVTPDELPAVMATTGKKRTHQIYVCEVAWDHMVRRRAGAPPPPSDIAPVPVPAAEAAAEAATESSSVSATGGSGLSAASDPLASRAEYHAHPDRYENAFQDTVAPYASAIFVCHYWENRFPRVLTIKQAQHLRASGRLRLQGVCDISCDMRGAVEFLSRFTSIEHPYYVWDPETDTARTAPGFMSEPGILFHAVDHLPSECPLEASNHFGSCLMPFVPAIAASSPVAPMEDLGPPFKEASAQTPPAAADEGSPPFLPAPIRGAVVTNAGKMAPQFEYILKLRAAQEAAASKRVVRLRRRESFVTLHLRGHLFDSGAINRVLDAVEAVEGASCVLQAVTVGASVDDKSEASMNLFAGEPRELSTAVKAVVEAAAAHGTHVDVAGPEDTPVSPASAHAAAADTGDATAGAAPPPAIGLPRPGSGGSIDDAVALAARSSASKLPQLPRFDADASAADPLADLASGLRSAPPKRVLLLGAGMVTRPLVRYLLRRSNNTLTVCSALPGEAESLCSGRARTTPRHMAISLTPEKDQPELDELVAGHDLVISMLPAFLHVGVARLCVARGRHMVTASYISPQMQALHEQAEAANVLLLNEMGVDPGFDHMSAMRMIAEAKGAGEVITGFESSTGGLPAPEVATNPLGYRFSWSPRGALVAARNAARFIRDGGLVDVRATDLLTSAEPYTAGRGFSLEVLPNRDSTSYAPKYGLGAAKADGGALESLFRGTLRYRGFSRQLLALASLGMLDAEPCGEGHDAVLDQAAKAGAEAGAEAGGAKAGTASGPTMRSWLASRCEMDPSSTTDAELVAAVCARADAVLKAAGRADAALNEEERAVIGDMLRFSGLLGSGPVPALEASKRTAVDALAVVLGALPDMQYGKGQRDMVVMQHRVHSRNTAGQTVERSALLVEYERSGESAMARTVGLTAAISAQLVLDGAIKMRGVLAPVHAEIYEPVLDALEGEGISMQEKQRILA